MGASEYKDLMVHVGHKIECVVYGEFKDPHNVAVECVDCCVVLMDFDKDE